jgi:hypothetical protein
MGNIHDAARFGDLKGLGHLLAEGANPDQRDEGGMTPLHYAASAGRIEEGKLLLENGAVLDFRDAEGATPLYFAAYFGKTEMAVFLLEKGADPNAGNQANYTPLHMAAERGHLPVVEALLAHGGDPNFAARNGDTPLSGAEINGHPDIVSLLRENLSRRNGGTGSTPVAPVGAPPASSPAPLHAAEEKNYVGMGNQAQDSAGLLGKVIDSFKSMPFVSVRVVCFYSSQDLYQMDIDIKAQKPDQGIPKGLQVFCIPGGNMEWKRVEVEKTLLLFHVLPNKGWDPGMPSYLVLITDSDGSFAGQVASLPLARKYALFFGYKPDVDARIRHKLSGARN